MTWQLVTWSCQTLTQCLLFLRGAKSRERREENSRRPPLTQFQHLGIHNCIVDDKMSHCRWECEIPVMEHKFIWADHWGAREPQWWMGRPACTWISYASYILFPLMTIVIRISNCLKQLHCCPITSSFLGMCEWLRPGFLSTLKVALNMWFSMDWSRNSVRYVGGIIYAAVCMFRSCLSLISRSTTMCCFLIHCLDAAILLLV